MKTMASMAAAVLLAGCASFSDDGGFGEVNRLTRERTGQPARWQRSPTDADSARTRSSELLSQPLTPDAAVELALLNHRGLQAGFAALGIAEAELVRAGRLAGPSFSFGRLSGSGTVEIDRALVFDLLGLLTMPAARALEQQRFAQAQLQAAHDAVGIAAEARQAWFDAVAAQQLAGYALQVQDAAEASGELARRMEAVGNFSKLSRMREQSFQLDATAQLARARQQALAARERLVRALGLDSGEALKLPERLPELPAAPLTPKDAEQTAIDERLDVRMAKRETEAVAASLGLTRATRFIDVLQAGYQNKSETGAPRRNGWEVELTLPLFDFGATRSARAEAVYMQSLQRTAQVATEARSQVREAHAAYRAAYDLAKHYRDEVVPLRQRISEENLLRYNGMLASVFELLADAREQIAGVTAAVEALREFWIADVRLRTALTGRAPKEPTP